MKGEKHFVLFVYNSYRDPLCQGILLSYVKKIVRPHWKFHLITFEQEAWAMNEEETQREKKELESLGIYWYPRPFRTGRFLLLKKALNLVGAFMLMTRLHRKYHPSLVLAMANVAGSMVWIITRMVRMPLAIYSFEPHSDFMAEAGVWNRSSLQYRVLHRLEWKAGVGAEFIFTGTRHLVERLHAMGAKGQVKRLPTGTDEERFQFSQEGRQHIRQRYGITDSQPVLIYPGKFGDLYITNEIATLCGELHARRPDFYFLFLTATDPVVIANWLQVEGVPATSFFAGRIPHSEMPDHLSAADLGLVGIADFPSRLYCSPTKVGEYLLSGLPYLVQKNTGEDDEVADKYSVGVVLRNFTRSSVAEVWTQIDGLLREEKAGLRSRCRNAGLAYRSETAVRNELEGLFEDVS